MVKRNPGPGEMFADEILSVCIRWWEESDLEADDIYNFGELAIQSYCKAQDPSFEVTEEIVFELEDEEEEE